MVSHKSLPIFNCFDVVRTVDLINRLHNIDAIAPVSFPGHSVILWQLNLEAYIGAFVGTEHSHPSFKCYDKFDVSSVPHHILSQPNILNAVTSSSIALESSLRMQTDVDLVYGNRKAMNRNWSNQKANPALKTNTEINKYYK